MPRVQLELPEHLPWSTRLTVQIGDINYGGHLSNDAVLRLAHEARIRWLATLGLSEKDVGGCGLIMSDTVVVFRAEAFHGDALTLELGPNAIGRAGFDLLYRLVRDADQSEIARLKTGMVCFDYERRRVVGIPERLRSALHRK